MRLVAWNWGNGFGEAMIEEAMIKKEATATESVTDSFRFHAKIENGEKFLMVLNKKSEGKTAFYRHWDI